jgi:hypothetical protein
MAIKPPAWMELVGIWLESREPGESHTKLTREPMTVCPVLTVRGSQLGHAAAAVLLLALLGRACIHALPHVHFVASCYSRRQLALKTRAALCHHLRQLRGVGPSQASVGCVAPLLCLSLSLSLSPCPRNRPAPCCSMTLVTY